MSSCKRVIIIELNVQNKELDTEKEMLIASTQSLAEFNLTQEPSLAAIKERLSEMYEEADKIYKRVIEKVNNLSESFIIFLSKGS